MVENVPRNAQLQIQRQDEDVFGNGRPGFIYSLTPKTRFIHQQNVGNNISLMESSWKFYGIIYINVLRTLALVKVFLTSSLCSPTQQICCVLIVCQALF